MTREEFIDEIVRRYPALKSIAEFIGPRLADNIESGTRSDRSTYRPRLERGIRFATSASDEQLDVIIGHLIEERTLRSAKMDPSVNIYRQFSVPAKRALILALWSSRVPMFANGRANLVNPKLGEKDAVYGDASVMPLARFRTPAEVKVPESSEFLMARTGALPTAEAPQSIERTEPEVELKSSREDELISLIQEPSITSTTRESLVLSRIGQGQFRKDVLDLWGDQCAVTGATTLAVIRASHIKPWCESTNEERLNGDNGIPLIATLDALFDEGLISFDDTGRMLVSNKLSADERRLLGVSEDLHIDLRSEKMKMYLQWHRQSFGFGK